MLGRIPRHDSAVPAAGGVVIGRVRDVAEALPSGGVEASVTGDGFLIKTVRRGSARYTVVAGTTDRGVLCGVFRFLCKIALEQPIHTLDEKQFPYAPIRWVNPWDTTQKIDGRSSSLRIVTGVALKPGDEIRIEGSPDGGESAALDYI